jgi:hypothetical protein
MTEAFSYEHLARTKSRNAQFENLGRQLDIIKAHAPEGAYWDIWLDICTKVFGANTVESFILFVAENKDNPANMVDEDTLLLNTRLEE